MRTTGILKPNELASYPRVIFHIDVDAFFASVEQLEHPEWRGRPVIVGGVHSKRGVVSTASYEARVFGVRSAMTVKEARQRCPHGIFVEGRHAVYQGYSRKMMEIIDQFSPVVEQISIDEAFLDMTGSEGLFGPPATAARRLKKNIFDILGITASVGVAPNKFLAKIASDLHKPDGLTLVQPEDIASFLEVLPVEKLIGVGKRTAPELHRLGLKTIGDVRRWDRPALIASFGENFGSQLFSLACGLDPREVEGELPEKSISHEVTFEENTGDRERLESTLLELCDRVARRARLSKLSGFTVSLIWRDPDFTRHSRNQSLPESTQNSVVLYQVAVSLLRSVASLGGKTRPKFFRLLGVRLSGFAAESQQISLFDTDTAPQVDRAMDAVRDKFGEKGIQRGRLLEPPLDP